MTVSLCALCLEAAGLLTHQAPGPRHGFSSNPRCMPSCDAALRGALHAVNIDTGRRAFPPRGCRCVTRSMLPQDPAFQNFTRLFLKAPEHTWGIDSKTAPASWDTWDNAAFRAARNSSEKFAQAEHSWARQSRYIEWSLQACRLPLSPAAPLHCCFLCRAVIPRAPIAAVSSACCPAVASASCAAAS